MEEVHLSLPQAPAWLASWMETDPDTGDYETMHAGPAGSDGPLGYARVESSQFTFIDVRVPNARELAGSDFANQVIAAYQTLARLLKDSDAGWPVRWWNYLPDIRRHTDNGLDWYMHFNAGRYAAMAEGKANEQVSQTLATASAVGHDGSDFAVHVLAAKQTGIALENPRQTPAYHYSSEYGPKPPCFARATGIDHTGRAEIDGSLMIGGTASIVGEHSKHVGDLEAQFEETSRNLASLLAHARREDPPTGPFEHQALLALISQMRLYVVRLKDMPWLVRAITQRFTALHRLEVVHAPLCRADLLLEIEGITQPGVMAQHNEPSLMHAV